MYMFFDSMKTKESESVKSVYRMFVSPTKKKRTPGSYT